MPKRVGAPQGEKGSAALELLVEYRSVLQSNDFLIRRLELLKKDRRPSIFRLANIKDLEEKMLPEGMQKENKLGDQIRDLLDELTADTKGDFCPEARQRAVIELRYIECLKWSQIGERVFAEWNDTTKKGQETMQRKLFRYHKQALASLDSILKNRGLLEK